MFHFVFFQDDLEDLIVNWDESKSPARVWMLTMPKVISVMWASLLLPQQLTAFPHSTMKGLDWMVLGSPLPG